MKASRRDVLKAGGAAFAGMAIGCQRETGSNAESVGGAKLPFQRIALVKSNMLKVNEPHAFRFPDQHSPCLLIKFDQPVKGGVGPDRNIVAFSQLCTHMGCPVNYEAQSRRLMCPCHFTMFDPEKAGQVICGQATMPIPQIVLSFDETDDAIYAEAVEGLIYGRQANLI